jgi:hypothetical protein
MKSYILAYHGRGENVIGGKGGKFGFLASIKKMVLLVLETTKLLRAEGDKKKEPNCVRLREKILNW